MRPGSNPLNYDEQGKRKSLSKRLKNKIPMKRCRYCKTTEDLTVDHKIPKSQGGSNDKKNLQCLCRRCNGIKSGLSHKQVLRHFNWFLQIQEARLTAGKKPYTLQ